MQPVDICEHHVVLCIATLQTRTNLANAWHHTDTSWAGHWWWNRLTIGVGVGHPWLMRLNCIILHNEVWDMAMWCSYLVLCAQPAVLCFVVFRFSFQVHWLSNRSSFAWLGVVAVEATCHPAAGTSSNPKRPKNWKNISVWWVWFGSRFHGYDLSQPGSSLNLCFVIIIANKIATFECTVQQCFMRLSDRRNRRWTFEQIWTSTDPTHRSRRWVVASDISSDRNIRNIGLLSDRSKVPPRLICTVHV